LAASSRQALRDRPKSRKISALGRVAEWFKAPVLKDEWGRKAPFHLV
jgi:hypothetical protein